jgi:LysM repeat protein
MNRLKGMVNFYKILANMNKFFLISRLGLVWGVLVSAGGSLGAGRPGTTGYRVPHPAEVAERLDDHERRIGYLETAGSGDSEGPPSRDPAHSLRSGSMYRVRKGDTLFGVAQRHRVSVEALAAANQLPARGKLSVGQVLRIPGHGAGTGGASRYGKALEPGEIRHTLREGETLYGLSRRYSVSPAELMRLNKISNAARLRPGTVLRIPGRSARGAASEPAIDAADTGDDDADALPENWMWHVVQAGESLSRIAARYGVDRRALERANSLHAGSTLQIGRRLKIPPQGESSTVAADQGDHSRARSGGTKPDPVLGYFALKGDTVESVAGQFGTDAETIRRLNTLGPNESLAPGRRIVVPNNGITD